MGAQLLGELHCAFCFGVGVAAGAAAWAAYEAASWHLARRRWLRQQEQLRAAGWQPAPEP